MKNISIVYFNSLFNIQYKLFSLEFENVSFSNNYEFFQVLSFNDADKKTSLKCVFLA